MVKLKDIPLQDRMRIQSVTDFFQPWKQTKTNKNKGKGLENGEIIEFLKKITNDTNDKDNTKININQTEEATESLKANTETTDEMDEGEDAGADNKMAEIRDEADDENKNKNKTKIKIMTITKPSSTKEQRK